MHDDACACMQMMCVSIEASVNLCHLALPNRIDRYARERALRQWGSKQQSRSSAALSCHHLVLPHGPQHVACVRVTIIGWDDLSSDLPMHYPSPFITCLHAGTKAPEPGWFGRKWTAFEATKVGGLIVKSPVYKTLTYVSAGVY